MCAYASISERNQTQYSNVLSCSVCEVSWRVEIKVCALIDGWNSDTKVHEEVLLTGIAVLLFYSVNLQ